MQFLDNRAKFLYPNFLVYMGEFLDNKNYKLLLIIPCRIENMA